MKEEIKKSAKDYRNSFFSLVSTASVFMSRLKTDNPKASWKNLITGSLAVLIFVLFLVDRYSRTEVSKNEVSVIGTGDLEIGESGDNEFDKELSDTEVYVVERGEGLWHVARKVCNNGYKFVDIAKQNGLRSNEVLYVGQKLLVDCGND